MAKVILQKIQSVNPATKETIYYLAVAGNGVIDADKLADNVAKETGLSKTIVKAAYEYLGKAVFDYMETGQSVQIPGLGTFQLNVRMDAVKSEAELSAANVTSAHISLVPGKELRSQLNGLTYEVKGGTAKADAPAEDGTGNGNQSQGGGPVNGGVLE